jgi:hypothetical protein
MKLHTFINITKAFNFRQSMLKNNFYGSSQETFFCITVLYNVNSANRDERKRHYENFVIKVTAENPLQTKSRDTVYLCRYW